MPEMTPKRRFCSALSLCLAILGLSGTMAAPAHSGPDGDHWLSGPTIETQANVFTTSTQEHGTVAALPGGGFVVAWDSKRQEHGGYAVVAQAFDADGNPVGGEVPVNQFIRNMQMLPAVSSQGKAVWFAWQSHGQDGSGSSVVARRFGLDLTDASGEIAVNQTRRGDQSQPAIAADPDGGAAVAWIDAHDGKTSRVMLRLFDAQGAPLCDEMVVNDESTGHAGVASVVRDCDGTWLVSWAHVTEKGVPESVKVRRVSRDGTNMDDAIVLNEQDGLDHVEPRITPAGDGGFAAVWHSATGNGFGVDLRFFKADGSPATDVVRVADASDGWKSGAGVVRLAGDRFLVVYNSDAPAGDGDGAGVCGRLFDHSGNALGEARALNVHHEGRQEMTIATGAQRVVADAQGRLAVCWSGASAQGDESSVNLTVHLPAGMTASTTPTDGAGERLAYSAPSMDAPIPPIWDPNHTDLEPLEGAVSDGPDFGFEAITSTGWTPPDPEMAVGPDRIVAITNGEIAMFDKSGNNLFRDEIEDSFGFWGAQGATNFVFDPEAMWDPHSRRYFAMACERSNTGRSEFLIAVSKTSIPNTANDWWKYRIDVTSISDNDIDSPNMAVDADNVLLTADFFGPDKYLLYFIRKDSILEGGAPVVTHELITGASQQSMGIPVMHDANAPAQYIIQSTENSNNNTVIFHALVDPFGSYSRTTFTLSVPDYTYPNQPPQRGTSSRPFLFEPRFWSCVTWNDSLWAVHHVNSSRVRARWYEFKMNGWPSGGNPEIAQWGELDYGGTIHTYFPSIGVDAAGNAAITFARSSPDEYISMSRAVRKFSDAPNTFQPPEFVKESTIGYNGSRWGDYSKTVNDPALPDSFWGHHEFTLDGQWRTWIARYDVGDPPLVLASSNLFAGVRGTLDVTGATPDSPVVFLYSIHGMGSTYIAELNVTVDLDRPVLLGVRRADDVGQASWSQRIPDNAQGYTVWLQAAQRERASNVVQKQIQ